MSNPSSTASMSPPEAVEARHRLRILPGSEEREPARTARRRRVQDRLLGFGATAAFLVVWQWTSSQDIIDNRFFPAPTDIVEAAVDMVRAGILQKDLLITVETLLLSLVIGFVVGNLAGIALGRSRLARSALEPLLSSFYTIPKLALLPLLLLIFGIGQVPKVILVSLGVFFIAWISMMEAIRDIPATYLETCRSFGIGRFRTLRRVLIPAVLPQVFVGLRIAVGNAILILIGVEFVSSGPGVGYRIWNSWTIFAADRMYVGIVVVALLGFVCTKLVVLLRRFFVPWAPGDSRD